METWYTPLFSAAGSTYYIKTTPSFLKRRGVPRGFKWWREVVLEVHLLPEQQKVDLDSAKRLVKDIPELSLSIGTITCGSDDDFAEKLLGGDQTWGHAWDHIYICLIERACKPFGFTLNNSIILQTGVIEQKQDCTTYQTLVFYQANKLPSDFRRLEDLACGYCAAVVDGEDFPLEKRLDEWKIYRSTKRPCRPRSRKNRRPWHSILAQFSSRLFLSLFLTS